MGCTPVAPAAAIQPAISRLEIWSDEDTMYRCLRVEFGVWGLGWGVGCGVWGLRFWVWGVRFGAWCLVFGVGCLGFRAHSFGSKIRTPSATIAIWVLGFGVDPGMMAATANSPPRERFTCGRGGGPLLCCLLFVIDMISLSLFSQVYHHQNL